MRALLEILGYRWMTRQVGKQDVDKAKANGVQIDDGVELVTADVTKGAEYVPAGLCTLSK